ncbi:MAG: hypothetical protein RR446_00735 [Lachnospiraceae bacterium]
MSNLFVWKEQLQTLYAKYSRYINKALQFILAFMTFTLIGHNVGFMKTASSGIVTLALAIICTFPPMIMTVLVAIGLVLLHMYAVSLGVTIVMAAVFLFMFIFYFSFTPKTAIVVLLTPIAFMLKIPVAIPIIFGLIGSPIYIVPITCGTMIFYMMDYVKSNVTAITGTKGLVGQLTSFAQQALQNKIMWITIVAVIICLFVVYTLRKQSMNNAWKIAIVSGAVVHAIIMVVGDMTLDIHLSYGSLIMGAVMSVLVSLVLEFFVFTVDYSRTEHLQFEDDEYCYFVKAVPKISIAAPEKTVKKINARQETVVIDAEEVKRRTKEKQSVQRGQTEEMLLAKSLREELNIQKMVEEELKK